MSKIKNAVTISAGAPRIYGMSFFLIQSITLNVGEFKLNLDPALGIPYEVMLLKA